MIAAYFALGVAIASFIMWLVLGLRLDRERGEADADRKNDRTPPAASA